MAGISNNFQLSSEEIVRKYIRSTESTRSILWLKHAGLRREFDKIERNRNRYDHWLIYYIF